MTKSLVTISAASSVLVAIVFISCIEAPSVTTPDTDEITPVVVLAELLSTGHQGDSPVESKVARKPEFPLTPESNSHPTSATPLLGSLHGKIISRDPVVRPPYDLILTRAGSRSLRILKSQEVSFAMDDLEPGDWTLEVHDGATSCL